MPTLSERVEALRSNNKLSVFRSLFNDLRAAEPRARTRQSHQRYIELLTSYVAKLKQKATRQPGMNVPMPHQFSQAAIDKQRVADGRNQRAGFVARTTAINELHGFLKYDYQKTGIFKTRDPSRPTKLKTSQDELLFDIISLL